MEVRAAVAALGDEAASDPPGCVALSSSAPEGRPRERPRPIPRCPRARPAPPPGHRRGGRHVLHVGVLRHGVPTHVEHSGDLDLERPAASIDRISFTVSRGTVVSFHPSRAARQSNRQGNHTARAAPRSRDAALLLKLLNFSCSRCSIPVITRTTS